VTRLSARRPNHHDHTSAQETEGDDALLAIVGPIIIPVQGLAVENLRSIGEIKPALGERPTSLGWIERDLH
jgi:hypothetical protein